MKRLILISLLAMSAFARDRFSYVYSHPPKYSMLVVMHGSVEEYVKLKDRFSGTYLWAKVDGREYLIRDEALLREIQQGRAPLEALEPDQRAVERRLRPLEKREEQLDAELDDLTDEAENPDEARVEQLREELRDVRRQMREYEREEARLDRESEDRERVWEAELQRIVERAIRNGLAQRLN